MKNKLLLFLVSMFCASIAVAQVPVMNPIIGSTVACSAPSSGLNYSVSASNSPTSYQWSVLSPSAGIIIANPSASVTNFIFPNTNLQYTIVCTASNAFGTSAPTFIVVKVYETPTVTFSGSQSYCQGSSTNLSASSTMLSASSTLSYTWSPTTGLSSANGQSVYANPQITTTYSVLVSNSTCTNQAMVTITVNPLPSFTPAITQTQFCRLSTQTLSLNGNATTYSINSLQTPSISLLNYSVSGVVMLNIIGETAQGCQSSASITFTVGNCTVGLKEEGLSTLNDLLIYPQPSLGHFFININNNQIQGISIYNQFGVLIRYYPYENQSTIKVNDLSPGIYIISSGAQVFKIIVL